MEKLLRTQILPKRTRRLDTVLSAVSVPKDRITLIFLKNPLLRGACLCPFNAEIRPLSPEFAGLI